MSFHFLLPLRQYVISQIPGLQILDDTEVLENERILARNTYKLQQSSQSSKWKQKASTKYTPADKFSAVLPLCVMIWVILHLKTYRILTQGTFQCIFSCIIKLKSRYVMICGYVFWLSRSCCTRNLFTFLPMLNNCGGILVFKKLSKP